MHRVLTDSKRLHITTTTPNTTSNNDMYFFDSTFLRL